MSNRADDQHEQPLRIGDSGQEMCFLFEMCPRYASTDLTEYNFELEMKYESNICYSDKFEFCTIWSSFNKICEKLYPVRFDRGT